MGILKIIDTRNLSSFFFLSFCFFTFHFFYLFCSTIIYYFFYLFIFLFQLSFYLSLIFLLLPLLFYYCYVSWLRFFSVWCGEGLKLECKRWAWILWSWKNHSVTISSQDMTIIVKCEIQESQTLLYILFLWGLKLAYKKWEVEENFSMFKMMLKVSFFATNKETKFKY